MKKVIYRSFCLKAIVFLSIVGLQTEAMGNNSDNTGGNVSDIEGGNVSDVEGLNVSDSSGGSLSGSGTSNSVSSITQQAASQLSAELEAAQQACLGGGGCDPFFSIVKTAREVLGQ